ncbi:hypothetical protein VTH82DRAFT_7259 [Thermothelomyces myriococcoides]
MVRLITPSLNPSSQGSLGVEVEVFYKNGDLATIPAYVSPDWEENWLAAQIVKALVGPEEEEAGESFGQRGRMEYFRSIVLLVGIDGKYREVKFRVLENAQNRVNVLMVIGKNTIREVWGNAWPPTHLPPSHAPRLPPPPPPPPLNDPLLFDFNEPHAHTPYQLDYEAQLSDHGVLPETVLEMHNPVAGSFFPSTQPRSAYSNNAPEPYPDTSFAIPDGQVADPIMSTALPAGPWCTGPELTGISTIGFSRLQTSTTPALFGFPDEQLVEEGPRDLFSNGNDPFEPPNDYTS